MSFFTLGETQYFLSQQLGLRSRIELLESFVFANCYPKFRAMNLPPSSQVTVSDLEEDLRAASAFLSSSNSGQNYHKRTSSVFTDSTEDLTSFAGKENILLAPRLLIVRLKYDRPTLFLVPQKI